MPRPAALVLFVLATAAVAAQDVRVWTFDAEPADALPDGFTLSAMRQPDPGRWFVRRNGEAGALVHAADGSRGYAMAVAPHAPLGDVRIATRLRLAGGARAGGLVWRYQDPNNYYAAVLDLAEGTLFLYLIRDGNRVTLEAERDLELDRDAWHLLRVVHERASVYVSLGGIRVFEERGGRLERTFGPGGVGVLATGESEVWFDELRIEPGRSRR